MVMDKGLGINQARDLAETTGHLIDFLKLGFGTSVVCKNVQEKVSLYKDHDMYVYVGGTLLEAFLVRGQFEDYIRFIEKLGCNAVEVSDGSISLNHHEKCRIISKLAEKYTVLSEVGAKEADIVIEPEVWIDSIKSELEAGSTFVIGEARESGNVGIYEKNGSADSELIHQILAHVPSQKLIWEAPLKQQQTWFISLLGSNVNLGNIAPADVAALETLRLGLRGDTFFAFLPDDYHKHKLTGG